jgi:hypothetical protein
MRQPHYCHISGNFGLRLCQNCQISLSKSFDIANENWPPVIIARHAQLGDCAQKWPCAMRLDALPPEVLKYLFWHVETPFALRLVCRALAAAGPRRTATLVQNFALVL